MDHAGFSNGGTDQFNGNFKPIHPSTDFFKNSTRSFNPSMRNSGNPIVSREMSVPQPQGGVASMNPMFGRASSGFSTFKEDEGPRESTDDHLSLMPGKTESMAPGIPQVR
jgi:hypothetical protein